jgi:hypothetical protein
MVCLSRREDVRRPAVRIAVRSVAPLSGGIGITVVAIQQASAWSWSSPQTLVTLAAGVTITLGFVLTQLRAAGPLVDVRLLGRRAFLANLVVLGAWCSSACSR